MSGQDLIHEQPLVPDQRKETADGLPVLAAARPVDPPRPVLPVLPAAAAAATGFVAGAATAALLRRHVNRKAARARRSAPPRPIDLLPIVASRTCVVRVHLIAKPRPQITP